MNIQTEKLPSICAGSSHAGGPGSLESSFIRLESSPFTPHQDVRFGLLEQIALISYGVLIAVGIAHHEPWADESQAWLMARDQGWWQLVAHSVRYEGSPALWHSLLWVFTRAQISFSGMRWLAGVIATSGIWLWLRYSPFPRLLKLLVPFTFFLAYQDAVVVRSYVLFAPLAFLAAALLRGRTQRPLTLALVLAMLANLSVHGFVLAAGMAVAYVFYLVGRPAICPRWKVAGAAAIFCAAGLVAVLTAIPPPDVNFSAGEHVEHSLGLMKHLFAGPGKTVSISEVESSAQQPGALRPVAPPEFKRTRLEQAVRKLGRFLSLITYPLSDYRALGLILFLMLLSRAKDARDAGERLWPGLAPYGLMLWVFTFVYMAPRHAGTLLTAFLVAAWLTWPNARTGNAFRHWREPAFAVALFVMCIQQIAWTAHAIHSDVYGSYSGDAATARFLQQQHADSGRVAGFYYHSIGPLIYFPRNIYFNQPGHSYWLWSSKVATDPEAPAAIATAPDFIVVGEFKESREGSITADWIAPDSDRRSATSDEYRIVPYLQAHGYEETHRFCGHAWMRASFSEELCQVVLQPERNSEPWLLARRQREGLSQAMRFNP